MTPINDRRPHELCPELDESAGGTFHHRFQAWLPDAVLGAKVDNFINLQRAKVLRICRSQVKLRIGSKRWLWWNRSSQEIPFDVTISFGDGHPSNESLKPVDVEINPLTNGAKPATVHSECIKVVRGIRESLVAHETMPLTG